MKVLVIGSEGQLGSEIKKFSKTQNKISWVFPSIKSLDLLKLDTIRFFLNNINPSIIINCAAYTNVDKAEIESKLANTINHMAVDIISRWTSDNNKKLIHISTDYVFNGHHFMPYNESDSVSPIGVYGETKREGELAVINSTLDAIVIRTSWLYSSYGNNFVKTMLRLGKQKEEFWS